MRREVTEHRATEAALADSVGHIAEIIDALPVGLVVLDGGGRMERVNRWWSETTADDPGIEQLREESGWHYPTLLRRVAVEYVSPSLAALAAAVEELLAGRQSAYESDVMRPRNGVERWYHCRAVPRAGGGAILTYDDVTERRAAERDAAHRATHDPLTGLPNRSLLLDRVNHAVARAQRHPATLAVLFLDLDHFKAANDTHGHPFGDELLRQVTHRLSSVVRPGDTLARYGGDEFVLLCEDLPRPEDAEHIALRILDSLERPVLVHGREVVQSASVGLAVAEPGTDASDLLARADGALLDAKEGGRARLARHDTVRTDRARRVLDLTQSLRRAVTVGDLELRYQPVVGLRDAELRGCEALVRWRQDGRIVEPAAFLSAAEESGLIVQLGEWVLDAACAQAAAWRSAGHAQPVFVNVSPAQLSSGLVDRVEAALRAHGLPGSALSVEISENTLMRDPAASALHLDALAALGVGLEVDDFGTGHSSLAHLGSLSPHSLKIDRQFVQQAHHDEGARRVVAATIALAHGLGLESTAEGVELPEQLAVVRALGCDSAQGYLLRRPVPAAEVWPEPFALPAG
nr:EAL domain-containing protein [Motilibacter aurantiacus]